MYLLISNSRVLHHDKNTIGLNNIAATPIAYIPRAHWSRNHNGGLDKHHISRFNSFNLWGPTFISVTKTGTATSDKP